MKKNIAFYNIYKIWGGGEKWHFEMALRLKAKGHNIFVLTPENGEFGKRAKGAGLNVVNVEWSKYSYLNIIRVFWLAIKLRSLKIDSFLYNSFLDVREVGLSAYLAGIKNKIYRVGMPIAPKKNMIYKACFLFGVDKINFISRDIYHKFKTEVPSYIKGKKTFFLTNGINPEHFMPSPRVSGDKIVIGNCVRLSKQKGLNHFINVASKFSNENGVDFVIGGEGEEEEYLKGLTSSLGLEEKVKFIGFQEKPQEFYKKIDILLFTSEYEGTARTIIEGLFCEKPIVCFDISSMKELVDDGVDGFTVEPFSIDRMYNSLKTLISDEERRVEMGKNGRDKALRKYDIRSILVEWEGIILG